MHSHGGQHPVHQEIPAKNRPGQACRQRKHCFICCHQLHTNANHRYISKRGITAAISAATDSLVETRFEDTRRTDAPSDSTSGSAKDPRQVLLDGLLPTSQRAVDPSVGEFLKHHHHQWRLRCRPYQHQPFKPMNGHNLSAARFRVRHQSFLRNDY